MIIFRLILGISLFILVPILLGLLFTKFMKQKNSLLWAFVIGYFVKFTTFQIIYLPMYLIELSFKTLQYTWSVAILVLSLTSIIINRKRFKELIAENSKLLKKIPNIMLLFIVLLIIQIYFPVMYMHTDLDDAYYVANTLTTIETNALFKVFPPTGAYEYTEPHLRYSLSGLTIYYAAISEILGIHPTILQHTIWPAIAIVLAYGIYALIGNKLFNRDKEKVGYFLVFLSIIHSFGAVSLETEFVFLGYRIWQGKALIAGVMVPAVFWIYLYCIENCENICYWLIFLCVMISAVFATCTSVFLLPIQVGVLSLITFAQNRKFSNMLKSGLCCLPQIITGILYFVLK